MRRAAVSIPANIAERFRRYHNKEFKQFLYVAMGSAAELETHLIIFRELSYVSEEELKIPFEKVEHLSRMATILLRKL